MEEALVIVGLALAAVAVWEHYRFRNRLKDILREHLTNPQWNWRTFDQLKKAIHADDDTTVDLLTAIGATPSERDRDVWTLRA
ncbi:MAG: hypothetical protein WBQ04_20205 [Candidatus Acidiferrales bacterium]